MGAHVKYLEQPGLSEKASSLEEARMGRRYTEDVPAPGITKIKLWVCDAFVTDHIVHINATRYAVGE